MDIKKYIRDIKDFPIEGILFKDIQPLLNNPQAFKYTVEQLSKYCKDADVIVAPDARGFLFGVPIAIMLEKPFVMVRKPGKLPGEVLKEEYKLEYGTNTLEIDKDLLKPGQKVVIIDDLLAIGGTAKAIVNLVEKTGAQVINFSCVIELEDLKGKDKISNIPVNSLIKY